MKHSVFNIFADYQYVTRNDSSFSAMVYGFYRIIAGRHQDPLTQLDAAEIPGNHIGVYDIVTLGIPWLVEAFFRGNWIRWQSMRSLLRILFQQLLGLLILVRAVLSAIVTILALPIVALYYFLKR